MKPTQKQIEQAFERGIKPGAVIRCASGDGAADVVSPCEDWWVGGLDSLYCSEDVLAWYGGRYATVLAPAPEEQRDTLRPKYSGEKSREFWDIVNALAGVEQSELYRLGVDLQNLEEHVLKRLNEVTPYPVKERTPEEKLEEAVELINELCSSSYAFVKNENTSRKRIFDKAQAFLKKIER